MTCRGAKIAAAFTPLRQERLALGDGYVWLAIAILRQAVIDAGWRAPPARKKVSRATRRDVRRSSEAHDDALIWLYGDEARWLAARLGIDPDVWRRYTRMVCGEGEDKG